MDIVLDFERPILELRRRIEQLKALDQSEGVALESSISQLERQATQLEYRIFNGLTPWQRTLIARHPERPYMLDYVEGLFSEWEELHGDRAGFDDSALIGGIARFAPKSPPIDESLVGQPVVIIGHQKGRNTKENILRNFGMARPEGYRKALRLMKLADRFGLPIIALIDTPGAYPGIDAEERGQAEAIARNIMEMSQFRVPIIAIVTGEGGSGGALAIGVANRVLMLGNSVYSVISPEGCAAILWRDRSEGPRAAEALQITANDCKNLGVIDEVIEEPLGGSHRHPERTMGNVERAIGFHLHELLKMTPEALVENRHARFRKMGSHVDPNQVAH